LAPSLEACEISSAFAPSGFRDVLPHLLRIYWLPALALADVFLLRRFRACFLHPDFLLDRISPQNTKSAPRSAPFREFVSPTL
jgi:hypothetical protein